MPCCRWPGKVQMRLTFTNPSEKKTFHATRNQNQICSNAFKNTDILINPNSPRFLSDWIFLNLSFDIFLVEEKKEKTFSKVSNKGKVSFLFYWPLFTAISLLIQTATTATIKDISSQCEAEHCPSSIMMPLPLIGNLGHGSVLT